MAAKKYKYRISYSAEGVTSGTINLTKKEAQIVAYALDTANWENLEEELYSGECTLDVEHPMKIE